jgi:LmbE family N-acetylglucosaminyl deacetylase
MSATAESLRAVVFAAHQDDETFGCGGSIIKLTDAGHDVDIVFLTSGGKGGEIAADELSAIREGEARDAAKVLGVPDENLTFLGYPDRFLTDYRRLVVPQVAEIIEERRPHIVYMHHQSDRHEDHQSVHRFVWEAMDDVAGSFNKKRLESGPWRVPWVLGYEVTIETALGWKDFNMVEDITDVRERKGDAISKYRTQMRNPISHDTLVPSLNMDRGERNLGAGRIGEAFVVYKAPSVLTRLLPQ